MDIRTLSELTDEEDFKTVLIVNYKGEMCLRVYGDSVCYDLPILQVGNIKTSIY